LPDQVSRPAWIEKHPQALISKQIYYSAYQGYPSDACTLKILNALWMQSQVLHEGESSGRKGVVSSIKVSASIIKTASRIADLQL